MNFQFIHICFSKDAHTLNLTEFQSVQTNITAFTLLDTKERDVGSPINDWTFDTPFFLDIKNLQVRFSQEFQYEKIV